MGRGNTDDAPDRARKSRGRGRCGAVDPGFRSDGDDQRIVPGERLYGSDDAIFSDIGEIPLELDGGLVTERPPSWSVTPAYLRYRCAESPLHGSAKFCLPPQLMLRQDWREDLAFDQLNGFVAGGTTGVEDFDDTFGVHGKILLIG